MKTRRMTLLIMGLTNRTLSAAIAPNYQQLNQLKRRRTRSKTTILFRIRARAPCSILWIKVILTCWIWTRPRAVPHRTSRTIKWAIWIRKMQRRRSQVCLIRMVISTTQSSPKKCSPSWAVFKRRKPTTYRNQTLPMWIGPTSISDNSKSCSNERIGILNHLRCFLRAI